MPVGDLTVIQTRRPGAGGANNMRMESRLGGPGWSAALPALYFDASVAGPNSVAQDTAKKCTMGSEVFIFIFSPYFL